MSKDAPVRSADGPSTNASTRWWLWSLTGGTAAVVIVNSVPAHVGPLACTVVELGTIAALVVGIRLNRPPQRLNWLIVLGAMSLLTAAKLVQRAHTIFDVGPGLPTMLVDWLYLVVYLLLAIALGILPLHGRQRTRLTSMTEVGILACTIVVLTWSGVVDPALDAFEIDTVVAVTASLLPMLGLLMVTTTARRVFTASTRTPSGVLTVLALVVLFAGDTVAMAARLDNGATAGAKPSMIGWLVATVLLATAALHPSAAVDPLPAERPSRGVMARGYVLLILVGPTATALALLRELHSGYEINGLDVAVPLAATTVTAVLLVFRLTAFARVAEQRATALDARTEALEIALSEQVTLRKVLSHQATHDPLTDLPNRTLFGECVDEALSSGEPGTVLLFDLDGFKDVNDRYGHEVGDELLVAISERVQQHVPAPHTLARLGGDEFAVLLRRSDHQESVRCAQAILAAVRRPFQVGPYQLYTAASLGLRALDSETGTARMLSDTDLALYAAKAAGRDQLVCYDTQLRTRHLAQARMVDRLRDALEHDQLSVYYQPVVDFANDRWVTVEALARWETDEWSVSPDQFIPVAEDSGLIVALGTWVLRKACRDAAGWHRDHGTRLAVNVSVHQLREADFAAVVRTALADSGLPPGALSLEITESVLVGAGTQRTQAIAHLTELRAAGVVVAIDDFGTGFSSLSYLRTLPIDTIKIDRAFVPCAQTEDPQQVAMVRAIVELARGLGLGTVVEGVETSAQATVLKRLGCELGQGYHYGRPVPADVISATLAPENQPA
ncbi:putative bifunctional diguanylate cyclase/phosphodiesterase [Cryptosporangium aurantiacum]|uniref:Diguanylate cyclase (GGDEF) domain-containing protein n=1 Tax=Cryptosporangium aurantiacum TaxID=134849 RepID=A0A1M7MG52_9ACTN|nr:bifunctional diguanylate cyclase/phosphodiesterase [Cryptosporangium aurantiacum]SHM89914.1 diguanylate cyclase (GGDEF) domain-containing protein [Cryptosporangium aurantiacum]